MGKKAIVICCVILWASGFRLLAQDSVLINYLVKTIAQQQTTTDAFFIKGIYPSYISNTPHFSQQKSDNNIFFNALINYSLQGIKPNLSLENALIIDTIQSKSSQLYSAFKNKKGRNTYNFWRTDTPYTFPYTWWIHRIKNNTALPDDMDDTVLSLSAQNTDSATAAAAHALMQQYTNTGSVKSIGKKYRAYNAYSVWYGKNFPVVFDVCVLSNVLNFVQTYNLPWTAADSASLQVIVQALQTGDYLQKPMLLSPYYGNPAIILYHVARLMHTKKIAALEAIKPQLIADATQLFAGSNNPLEKAILCTAIFKWDYIAPNLQLPAITAFPAAIEQNDLPFFIGNIPSYFSYGIKKKFTQKGWGLFYHYCPAYNNVLMLEYLIWKQKANRF